MTDKLKALTLKAQGLTIKEAYLMMNLYYNHFEDSVWCDCVNDSYFSIKVETSSIAGIVSSLSKKGFLATDNTSIWITDNGEKLFDTVKKLDYAESMRKQK